MATIGGAFPAEFLRRQILRRLVPGKVIKLRQVMDDGEIHEKRFVVIRVDEDSVCCVINSHISHFIQNRPGLLRCQVEMAADDHDFMDHDSHIDCSRTWTFNTARVVDDLVAQTEWILGDITAELREDIIAALKFAPTLSVMEVEELCASLERAAD